MPMGSFRRAAALSRVEEFPFGDEPRSGECYAFTLWRVTRAA